MVVIRIAGMDRLPSGFVVEVRWMAYKYVDGIQGQIPGAVKFTQEGDDFVPFGKLTEDLVLSWLNDKLDLADLESKLDQQIEAKRNTQDPYPELPWSRFRVK